MSETVLYSGEKIKELLPQREPILMVDKLYYCNADGCLTGVTIGIGNMFCDAEGRLSAEGIIEHMAQSASVYMGYNAIKQNKPQNIGYIGEVRDFELADVPHHGNSLETTIEVVSEVMNVVLVKATTTMCGGNKVASCRLKITN